MAELPGDRIARGEATPADIAQLDQSRAEAANDLMRLREHFTALVATGATPDAAHVDLAGGLIKHWPPVALAAVLVEALRQLEQRERCEGCSPPR